MLQHNASSVSPWLMTPYTENTPIYFSVVSFILQFISQGHRREVHALQVRAHHPHDHVIQCASSALACALRTNNLGRTLL
eukprot:6456353-Amphidinium_carterae.1